MGVYGVGPYGSGLYGQGGTDCPGAIQVVAMRVASLSATGAPLTGANLGYVTANVMSAEVKPVILKGASETLTAEDGSVCENFHDCDQLKSFDLTVELCTVEPDLVNLMTGYAPVVSAISSGTGRVFDAARIYDTPLTFDGSIANAAATSGSQYPTNTAACANGVCVEFWELAWDSTTQAASNLWAAADTLTYWHHVFPRTYWHIDDQKISNKFRILKLSGWASDKHKVTADGPFDDWDAAVVQAEGAMGLGGYFLDDEFPAAHCGPIPVPSLAS